ncbi:DUF6056 family protein [Xanthomonadaceae bacterium JHOS43]|nr:DUF6056 family protein [Xanthomonadaceae bacterium JHOS43]
MRADDEWSRWSASEWLSLVALAFAFVLIASLLQLRSEADDVWFQQALEHRSLGEFLWVRYQQWSGRTLIDALMVSTIGYPLVWRLAIPASLVGLAWCLWRMTLSRWLPAASGTLLVMLGIFSMSRAVLIDSVWWISGFYNYLLPCVLGCFSLVVLMRETRPGALLSCLGILATLVACQQEQVALAWLAAVAALIVLRLRSGRSIRHELVFALAGAAALVALFCAPGNYRRQLIETRWFPEYVDLDVIARLGTGLDRLNAHLHAPDNLLPVVVASVALLATLASDRRHWARWPVCLGLVLFIVNAILHWRLPSYPRALGHSDFLAPSNWSLFGTYASHSITLACYALLAGAAAYRARGWNTALVSVGLVLLSPALVMLVAFSPTIYASGNRILFLPDVLLLAHACMAANELFRHLVTNRPVEPRLDPT